MTLELTLFTFCPPGPWLREKVSSISSSLSDMEELIGIMMLVQCSWIRQHIVSGNEVALILVMLPEAKRQDNGSFYTAAFVC